MSTDVEAMRIPIARQGRLDPPVELAELRKQCPITPLTHADGHVGWFVTSYWLARQVLSDPRFSSRPDIRHSAVHEVLGDGKPPEEDVPGMFVGMDPPEHTRYRKLLTGELSLRRMRELEPKIEATARSLIADMRASGPTADLVPAFASPLPSLTICDMLGVPYEDALAMLPVSQQMLRTDSTVAQVKECYRIIAEFLQNSVERKQREPEDDLISGLIETNDLSTTEVTSLAFQLFTAGNETTANMLSLGTFTLLSYPEQLAEIRADPTLFDGAIEELLRYLTIIQFGVSRGALEDVELGGVTVKAGQTVTVSLPGANRDPDRFPEPDVFDIHRRSHSNLAFGFGVHQCVAQQMARTQLRIGYQTLFSELPELALAVPADAVDMRTTEIVYGVRSLPVTW